MESPEHYKNTLDEGGKQTRRQQAETLVVLVKLYKYDKDLEVVTLKITSKVNWFIIIQREAGTSQKENVGSGTTCKFEDSIENPQNRKEIDQQSKEGQVFGMYIMPLISIISR